jgi:hypothetical protein
MYVIKRNEVNENEHFGLACCESVFRRFCLCGGDGCPVNERLKKIFQKPLDKRANMVYNIDSSREKTNERN